MKVGMLLYGCGMPRQAFDNFSRRGHLDFLSLDVDAGVDRFSEVHALGLATFWSLRRMNVEPAGCSAIVNRNWQRIARVAIGAARASDDEIGIEINSLGIVDDVSWSHPKATGKPVGRVSVSLSEINKDVRRALGLDEA